MRTLGSKALGLGSYPARGPRYQLAGYVMATKNGYVVVGME